MFSGTTRLHRTVSDMSTYQQRHHWTQMAAALSDSPAETDVAQLAEAVTQLCQEVSVLQQQLDRAAWAHRDAQECARELFRRLPDGEQAQIIDDDLFEWDWIRHTDLTDHPGWPPHQPRRPRR